MGSIVVRFDECALALGNLATIGAELSLPEYSLNAMNCECNTHGYLCLSNLYTEFQNILYNYRQLVARDIQMAVDLIGCIVAYDQEALNSMRSNVQNFEVDSYAFGLVEVSLGVSGSPSIYSFELTDTGDDDYVLYKSSLDNQNAVIITGLRRLISACDQFATAIQNFADTEGIDGVTAEAIKNYWSNIHGACVSKIALVAQDFIAHTAEYLVAYDSSSTLCSNQPFVLIKSELESVKAFLIGEKENMVSVNSGVVNAVEATSSETNGEYNYSDYIPNYSALSDKFEEIFDYIDSIHSEVNGIENDLVYEIMRTLNTSFSDLNNFINSMITNVNCDNVQTQTNGVPVVLADDYELVCNSIYADYLDIINNAENIAYGSEAASRYNESEELQARYDEIELELVGDVIIIFGSAALCAGTLGASSAPTGPLVISGLSNFLAVLHGESDFAEDFQTWENLANGDLENTGTNYLYEADVVLFDESFSRGDYNLIEGCVFIVAGASGSFFSVTYDGTGFVCEYVCDGSYGSLLLNNTIESGTNQIVEDVVYNVAIDNGVSPLQARIMSIVAAEGSEAAVGRANEYFGNDTVINEIDTTDSANVSDINEIDYDDASSVNESNSANSLNTNPQRQFVSLTASEADDIVNRSIGGYSDCDSVLIGVLADGDNSFIELADELDAQYFYMSSSEREYFLNTYGADQEAYARERFLLMETSSGRDIYLSTNPNDLSDPIFAHEVQYLRENGYDFIECQDGLWQAVR